MSFLSLANQHGFSVQALGVRVWGLGLGIQGLGGSWIWGLGFGFEVWAPNPGFLQHTPGTHPWKALGSITLAINWVAVKELKLSYHNGYI